MYELIQNEMAEFFDGYQAFGEEERVAIAETFILALRHCIELTAEERENMAYEAYKRLNLV